MRSPESVNEYYRHKHNDLGDLHESVSRKKKGISTILGGLFFILAVISSLSIMSWTVQQQSRFSTTTTEVNALQMERQLSDLEVTEVKIDSSKFNVTLQNNGPQTDRIVRLWITNETAPNWHQKYDIDYIVNPKQTITNVGQTLPVNADSLKAYKFSLVTEKGNIIPVRSLSVAQANLKMSMYTIPSTISTGENVTLMMTVTNNARDVDSIHNLQPTLNLSYTCVLLVCPTAVQKSAPATIQSLPRDSTALFKWVYNVQGPPTSKVTFTGNLVGANPSNAVSETLMITSVTADIGSMISIVGTNSGFLMMNFTSFQFCKPSTQDCRSNSLDWGPGWQVTSGSQYIWRVNMTNGGTKDIILDRNSSVLLLHVQTNGGGNMPTAMFIKADSTLLNEDPGAYVNYSKILRTGGQYSTIYLGVSTVGGTTLQSIPSTGMYAVNLILFGYTDQNNNGVYNAATDLPYSQNLPFQGLLGL